MRRSFGRGAIVLALVILASVFLVLHMQYTILNESQNLSGRDKLSDTRVPKFNAVINSETKNSIAEDLNVYVVEEHHAVLKYWFDAARSGLVATHGNVLVHIDGHSDLAMPFNTAFYPTFRHPQTTLDLEAMMQSNDVFIMAATISGLFKEVIWIWPSWDKSEHDDVEDVSQFKIGVSTLGSDDLEEFGHTFCMCYTNVSTNQEMCVYTPVKADREDVIKIPNSSCDVHTTLNVITAEETLAVESLLDSNIQNSNIVLDIDEDYYGCTLPAQDLVDVGVTVDNLQDFNDILDKLFCPQNVGQENKTDKMLHIAVEMLKSEEACKKVAKFAKCTGVARRATTLYYLERESLNLKIRCPLANTKYAILLRKLVSKLSTLNTTQLSTLQVVGFCISTMLPATSNLWESTFGVCIGNNVPGQTMVFNHPTNSSEIVYRTSVLKNILKSLKKANIQITTVCRSIRDGYTPRKHFHHIEHDVLNALNVLGRRTQFHFDSWLLGGKKGWYDRYSRKQP